MIGSTCHCLRHPTIRFVRRRPKSSCWRSATSAFRPSRMTIEPRLDIIGAALADPSRSRILCELMDGRAFTNKELACAACIAPQTASEHLKQLELAGLTSSLRSGRCVYHRIASSSVAETLESLARLSPTDHLSRSTQACEDTRRARSCYNHIAGRLGVLMTDRLRTLDILTVSQEIVSQGPRYQAFLDDLQMVVSTGGKDMVPAKLCLDWTERRHHIAGPLATATMRIFLERRWLERRTGSRALTVTQCGYNALERLLGLTRNAIDYTELL